MKACLDVCEKCKHFKKDSYNVFIYKSRAFYILPQCKCLLNRQTVLSKWFDGEMKPEEDVPTNCIYQLEHIIGYEHKHM